MLIRPAARKSATSEPSNEPDSAAPARFPLACGALGRYEAERVVGMSEALGAQMATVHRDESSVLMLDRPPLSWDADTTRGLAWSEGITHPGRVRSWLDAACRWGACGLVIEGTRRYLHTSVAGVAPVYYFESRGATYFASRIDALVAATASSLTVDWDAWATIFCLGQALGARTPFLEVRRMEPFSVLQVGSGAVAQIRRERWPWAEIEPKLSLDEGARQIVHAARSAVSRLPAERILVPLS